MRATPLSPNNMVTDAPDASRLEAHTLFLVREFLQTSGLTAVLAALDAALPGTWWGFSAHGSTRFTDAPIDAEDVLVFGAERAGLTDAARARIGNDQLLSIPMVEGSRSLNLANAVAVVVYDTWRRHGYPGSAGGGTVAEAPRQPPF